MKCLEYSLFDNHTFNSNENKLYGVFCIVKKKNQKKLQILNYYD